MREITTKLKERFCKDNNLNIKIFKEPYFSERLELYEEKFSAMTKWQLFINEISEFETDEEYFAYYNSVKEKAIQFIKSQPKFKDFLSCDLTKYSVNTYGIPSSNIFHEQNNNQEFISIDLKKGCYAALRFFSPSIVNNTNTYEEFISQFTNKKSLIDSKYIRQVIFGNCKPERQTTIEKYMMGLMMEKLQKLNLNFVGYTDDEIVIRYDKAAKEQFEKIKSIVYNTTKKYDFDIHFEVFKIEKIRNSDVYVKKFLDGKDSEIKCANHLIMPFILRILKEEEPQINDFIFFENKNLAFFMGVDELEITNPLFEHNSKTNDIKIENIDEER